MPKKIFKIVKKNENEFGNCILRVKPACKIKSIIIPGNAKVAFILEKYGYLNVCIKGTAKYNNPTITGVQTKIEFLFNSNLNPFLFHSAKTKVTRKYILTAFY